MRLINFCQNVLQIAQGCYRSETLVEVALSGWPILSKGGSDHLRGSANFASRCLASNTNAHKEFLNHLFIYFLPKESKINGKESSWDHSFLLLRVFSFYFFETRFVFFFFFFDFQHVFK